MHQADMAACVYERSRIFQKKENTNKGGRPTKKQKLKNVKMPEKLDFKSIFGDNATGGSPS